MSIVQFTKIIKYQLIITVGILICVELVLIVYLFSLFYCRPAAPNVIPAEPSQNHPAASSPIFYRRIDGSPVMDENQSNLYPVAVVIDNHPDSRPNFGLSYASVVYETLVEGGATRFLAIYTPDLNSDAGAGKIGPVRSVRPYFLYPAKEYNALLAHSGGSPQALREIKQLNIPDLEEIAWWGPDYFWRVYSRESPHNLFTSEANLAQAAVDWDLAGIIPDYQAWKFDYSTATAINIDNINNDIYLDFSAGTAYDVNYVYHTTTDSYLRYQSGEEHVDGLTGQPIMVKNVIVQSISPETVLDGVGRLSLDLYGSGDAVIYSRGAKTIATWQRPDIDSRTIFYNKNGQEILFAPGNIWIEILPE